MISEYILVFSIVFIISFLINREWNGRKPSKQSCPPSLPTLPLVGSLPYLRKIGNIAEFFMDKSFELGPIFTFRAGSKLVLVLNNLDVIKEALVKNSRAFSSRPRIYMQVIGNPNNKGIVFSEATPEWKRIHQTSLSIMKEFGFGDKGIMQERILREVEATMDFLRQQKGTSFDPRELFFRITFNIIMSMLFGIRSDYKQKIHQLSTEVDALAHLMHPEVDIAPFLKFLPPYRGMIHEISRCTRKIYNLIEAEIAACLQKQETCFAREFIAKEGPGYDQERVNFILRDLLAAGTDTTANTLLWALTALTNHPKVQRKCQDEIDSLIPRDKFPTLQDRAKLPYVEATTLEILRWRTLLTLSVFHCTSRDAVLKGYHIPAGTMVLPNFLAVHTNLDVWGDPDVFRPERFLDKENNIVGSDRVISFSLGHRSCLGEILARSEIFLILTSLLQNFSVLPPEGQDSVRDNLHLPISIVASPSAFSVRFIERQ